MFKVFNGINSSVYENNIAGFVTPFSTDYTGSEFDSAEGDPVTEREYNISGGYIAVTFTSFY